MKNVLTKSAKRVRKTVDPVEAAILQAIKQIPRGRVSTYGDIAKVAGLPNRARLVGTVLKQTGVKVPWQRVINASGRISFPSGSDAYRRQETLLKREGVTFERGRVDLKRFGWPARSVDLDELLWARG